MTDVVAEVPDQSCLESQCDERPKISQDFKISRSQDLKHIFNYLRYQVEASAMSARSLSPSRLEDMQLQSLNLIGRLSCISLHRAEGSPDRCFSVLILR